MKLAFSLSRYVAVRDEVSQAALARFIDKAQISVVPDVAFGIPRRLGEGPSSEFNCLRNISALAEPYIIIQAAHGLEFFSRFLKKHARRLQGYRFLALPIGPALGDHSSIVDADLPGLVRLPLWPHPLLLAELISRAVAVVGYSYHLAITALAFGVPVFTPVETSVGRFSAFLGSENLFRVAKDSELDIDWFLGRLGKTAPPALAGTALDQLAHHWDHIATILREGKTGTQPALNRFWQSLPGLLETAETRHEAAVAEWESQNAENQERNNTLNKLLAQSAEKQERINTLNKLLGLARAEIVARDDRIAALRSSPSWRVTAPARFLMRNLKLLVRRHAREG